MSAGWQETHVLTAASAVQVVTALCTVLSTVMQHMPIGYVRSKFDTVSAVIVSIVKETREKSEKNALKAALACLIKTLCCLDTSGATWASAKQPLLLLMDFTMSDNPKVRKLAHEGVTEVMATVRSTPAQQHASREVLQGTPELPSVLCLSDFVPAALRLPAPLCCCPAQLMSRAPRPAL